MKIGTLLTLEINNPETGDINQYRSKIIEKNADYLFIDLPIDNETNKTAFFMEGTHFKITYIGKDQAVHTFQSKLTANVKGNVPTLAIHFPDKEEIKTIQRRRFVRVDTAVDVAAHSKTNAFTTVTSDISGGGMSIILPESQLLNAGERADIWMVLQMHSGDYQYIHTTAEVTRINEDETGVRKASLKFISIDKKKQQWIIRYCFEKQLEAKKKEIT